MNLSLVHIIPSVAIFFNALFLGILFLIVKSKNKKANNYLAIFLLLHCINILNNFFGEFEELFEIHFVFEPILFVFPLLYFYLISTINIKRKIWYYFFFIPGIILNILLNSNFLLSEELLVNIEIFFYTIEILIPILAYMLLHEHNEKIRNYFSDIENKTLQWLKNIFTINVIIHFLNLITFCFDLSTLENLEFLIDSTSIFLTVFMLFYIGYNGYAQHKIIFNNSLNFSNYNSKVIEEKLSLIKFNSIKKHIQSEKIYLDENINLRAVSLIYNLNENELSRMINKFEKTNFYFFINKFRVDEFKELIKLYRHDKLTLFSVANEAGFKNKSTFNTSFKRFEGMTPSSYLKSIENE